MRRRGQEELSEQRIRELTSPEVRRGLHEKHEAAKNAAALLADIPKRIKDRKSPDDMGTMVRIVSAFMEPEQREGAKERNAALLESLKTPEGKRELAIRALDMVEKTDENIFLEREPDKVVKNVGDNSELMTFAFVFDALTAYMRNQGELDGRIAESLGQRKKLWETSGPMNNLVKNMASPLYELLGSLTMEENLRIQSVLDGGKTAMDVTMMNVLSGYFGEQLSTGIYFQEDGMTRAGKEPFSPERQQELLSDRSRDALHQSAVAAMAKREELVRLMELYPARRRPETCKGRLICCWSRWTDRARTSGTAP